MRDDAGALLASASVSVSCRLPGGGRSVLLRQPLPREPRGAVRVVGVAVGIPTRDPGRAMYREWAWLRRPTEVDEIDREIAALRDLDLCPSR